MLNERVEALQCQCAAHELEEERHTQVNNIPLLEFKFSTIQRFCMTGFHRFGTVLLKPESDVPLSGLPPAGGSVAGGFGAFGRPRAAGDIASARAKYPFPVSRRREASVR